MRKIRTSQSYVEFLELDDNSQVLNSKGFQFGELCFEMKNHKVSFFMNDPEKPFGSMVWSIDIPFYLDDVLYDNEDDASAALHNIMNDRFQEQLDALNEELAGEEARAQAAEEALGEEIDDERDRAISAETFIQTEVTELSGTVATFDNRITTNTNAISALTDTVNGEIARSTGKDAEHDAEISGLTAALATETAARIAGDSALTDALNSEIQRALSAETSLHNEIIDERNRAIAAESGITDNLNAEISRSTQKDAQHDAQISALTVSLTDEINRATGAENTLRNDLNAEIQNRISGDTNLQSQINVEVTRATSAETALHNEILDERNRALAAESALTNSLNSEITRSTEKDASQDALISGLTTSLQNEINRSVGADNSLRNDLNSEISARTSVDAEELQRIASLETGKADANSVYTKTESDNKYATKDYLSGLTENIYTKGEVNTLLNDKADKVSAVSSALYNSQSKTIDFKNISGTVISSIDARDFIKDGMVDNVAISGSNLVITFNTDAGKEPISIALTDIFDPSNYYNKTEIDNIVSGVNTSIDTISGDVQTLSGNIQTISGDVQTLSGEVQTISGSAITTGDVQTMIDNSISGKQDTLSAGTNIQINNNVISATDTKYTAGSGITITGSTNKITLDANIYKGNGMVSVSLNNPSGTQNGYNRISGMSSIGAGYMINTSNAFEAAFGTNNKNNGVNDTFNGSSGNTLFTVGNGANNDRHNAFEIRQNGDIYIADTNSSTGTYYQKPMIKLQDALSQGGGGIEYSAGTNVQINNNVISATDTTYSAGDGISISNSNVISTVTKFWCGTEQEWSQISGGTLDSNTIYMVH